MVEDGVARINAVLKPTSALTMRAVRANVQARMSDRAGMICEVNSIKGALEEARTLNADIRAKGIAYGRAAEAVRALQWQQMALASEAVLAALDHFVHHGGGSRGARAICDPDGESVPLAADGPLENYRFRKERDVDRSEQIVVTLDGDTLHISTRPNRRFDESAKSFFERDWPDWLTGRIYDLGTD
jgi:hypothetical protein